MRRGAERHGVVRGYLKFFKSTMSALSLPYKK
jgi:hypothetical protein